MKKFLNIQVILSIFLTAAISYNSPSAIAKSQKILPTGTSSHNIIDMPDKSEDAQDDFQCGTDLGEPPDDSGICWPIQPYYPY